MRKVPLTPIQPNASVEKKVDWCIKVIQAIANASHIPEQINVDQLPAFDEAAQDAVGGILSDAGDIDFTYDDATPAISAVVKPDAISDAKLRDSAAVSVIGRAANSAGDPADIAAGANDRVLARVGDALAFQQLTVGMAPNDVWTNAKLADMPQATIKGRQSGAGTGDPEDLTAAQARTVLGLGATSAPSGASLVGYDNTTSVLTATDVQAAIDENDGRLDTLEGQGAPGLVLLASGTVINAATLDIVLTAFTAYRAFKFLLNGFDPQTDAARLLMRTSSNGGSTYDAGANDYAYGTFFDIPETASAFEGDQSTSSIVLTEDIGNAAGEGVHVDVTLYDPFSAVFTTRVAFHSMCRRDGGEFARTNGSGQRNAAADVDAVRFLFSSGNIVSGSWAVYGYA